MHNPSSTLENRHPATPSQARQLSRRVFMALVTTLPLTALPGKAGFAAGELVMHGGWVLRPGDMTYISAS